MYRFYLLTICLVTYNFAVPIIQVLSASGIISTLLKILRVLISGYVLFVLLKKKETVPEFSENIGIILTLDIIIKILDFEKELYSLSLICYYLFQSVFWNYLFSTSLEISWLYSILVGLTLFMKIDHPDNYALTRLVDISLI